MLKNKGFTLVELLAVITILGVITLIAFPYANNLLKKSKDNEYSRFLDDIYLATEAYLVDNSDNYTTLSNIGGTEYIHLKKVVENGYLRSTTINPKTNEKIDLNTSVKVTLNDDKSYSYEFMNKNYDTNAYVQNGLVTHYDAINNTGNGHDNETTIWKDLSGNNNDGTLTGFTFDENNGWQTDSLYINKANRVIATNVELTNFTSSDFTISATFINKCEGENQSVLVSNGNYQTYGYYVQFRSANRISINTNQSGASQDLYSPNESIYEDEKYDVTFVRSGSNMKVYVNGVKLYETNNIVDPASSALAYMVNANGDWIGNIMGTRVYNRALTETEVKQNYEIDKVRFGL